MLARQYGREAVVRMLLNAEAAVRIVEGAVRTGTRNAALRGLSVVNPYDYKDYPRSIKRNIGSFLYGGRRRKVHFGSRGGRYIIKNGRKKYLKN